jgi:hypothetical protein
VSTAWTVTWKLAFVPLTMNATIEAESRSGRRIYAGQTDRYGNKDVGVETTLEASDFEPSLPTATTS